MLPLSTFTDTLEIGSDVSISSTFTFLCPNAVKQLEHNNNMSRIFLIFYLLKQHKDMKKYISLRLAFSRICKKQLSLY